MIDVFTLGERAVSGRGWIVAMCVGMVACGAPAKQRDVEPEIGGVIKPPPKSHSTLSERVANAPLHGFRRRTSLPPV